MGSPSLRRVQEIGNNWRKTTFTRSSRNTRHSCFLALQQTAKSTASVWQEIDRRTTNLKVMSAEALIELRNNIDRVLSSKISVERRDLQVKLAKLETYTNGRAEPRRRSSLRKGIKLPPKFRGPKGETWAGRGARPRWLSALIRQGRKLDEFAIDKALAARKGRKARRKKK